MYNIRAFSPFSLVLGNGCGVIASALHEEKEHLISLGEIAKGSTPREDIRRSEDTELHECKTTSSKLSGQSED